MADYGLTADGFVPKRLEDIKADVEAGLREKFGEIDTEPSSVFGQIIGVMSSQLTELWEQLDVIYKSQSPSSAEGFQLDEVASLTNITRLAATASAAIIQVQGDESTVVPAGTSVSQEITGQTFTTDEELVVSVDTLHKVEVSFTVANTTTYSMKINNKTISYTSSGAADEDEIKEGLLNTIANDSDLIGVVTASGVTGEAKLIISTYDFSSITSFTLTNLVQLSLVNIWSPISITCTTTGNIAVPANSISKLDNAISGITSIINTADGVNGRDVETDDAFRIRRIEALSSLSSSTLASIVALIKNNVSEVTDCFGYENTSDDVVSGMPGHSFEIIVNAADTALINEAIAEVIWENKPAGIATHGNTSVDVTDINGDNQIVKFSHATNKYVHIELTYDTTDSDVDFPANGEQLIKDRLIEIGESYTFGSDILRQVLEAAGYVAGGVSDVSVRIAATTNPGDTPTWQTANIRLEKQYLPLIAESRITLIKVA